MKNLLILFTVIIFCPLSSSAQERLFFLGYTKNYISEDSTNFTLNFDLNRVPGATEKIGGTFFYNDLLATASKWRFYVKPSADFNIGTGTTSQPNNINVGIPAGFSYDGIKLCELSLEASPEFVADKYFDNFLLYASAGAYFKVESKKKTLIDVSTGFTFSNGKRTFSDKIKQSNTYGRFTIPLFVKFACWEARDKKDPSKQYFKIQLNNTFKFNNIYEDDPTITTDNTVFYYTGKFEFYFIPRLALSVAYTDGYEEPLFKKVRSLSLGLTFARF